MDKITHTEKVTSPYFSNGSLPITRNIKSSLSDTNETYFFGISNSSTLTTEEFNVTFGSTNDMVDKLQWYYKISYRIYL